MGRYDWPAADRLQQSIASGRLFTQVKARIGLDAYALDSQRDAALAELLATTSEVFNVKSFGAKGDGATDDGAAFNSAIVSAGEAGGGVVYAPPSSLGYVLQTVVAMNQANVILRLGAATYTLVTGDQFLVTAVDCAIIGDGWTATFIDHTGNTTGASPPIRVQAARFRCADLKITGATTAAASNVSNISGTSAAVDMHIQRVYLTQAARGISTAAVGTWISDSRFESQRHSGILFASGSSKAFVSRSSFNDCNQDEAQNSAGIRIDGNSASATFDSGFLISECFFDGNKGNHIAVLNGGGGASGQMRTRDVGIMNSTFLTCPANTPGGGEGEGIAATCNGLRVIGNYFRDIEHEAVNWTAPGGEPMSGCIIANNYVEDVTTETGTINALNGSAFEIVAGAENSTADNFVVTGNVCVDTRGGSNKTRALLSLRQAGHASAAVTNGVVSGNTMINSTLGQVVEITEVASSQSINGLNDLGNAGIPDRTTFHGKTATAGASDTSPSVQNIDVLITGTSAVTINDFDDGKIGQRLKVISKGAITFDLTGTNLTGSSVDIVTASGDTTTWFTENGTTWRLTGYVDASVDNSAGA